VFPIRDLNPSRTTPWITWCVILLCGLIFLFQAIQPPNVQAALVATFALTPASITAMLGGGADPFILVTVLTSMFMHGGLAHVLGNLWFLRIFGDNVEDNFGHGRFIVFYLLCGIAAAAAQWAVDPGSTVPMLGASGAIAGVLAAYLVLYPRARVLTLIVLIVFWQFVELPAFVLIGLWFVLQAISGLGSLGAMHAGGVAFFAHIGGFVAGLVLTLVFRRRSDPGLPPWTPAPRVRSYEDDEYQSPWSSRR
jgi:membrane associated rhomboid family serine protease